MAWVWKDLAEFEIATRTFTAESCKKPREPSGLGWTEQKTNLNRREAVDPGRG